jgi:secondary thiamine-phosphate synthase enzyme
MHREIKVKSSRRSEFMDITGEVIKACASFQLNEGAVSVYVPHTTAGVTINENADPSVVADLVDTLDRLIPWDGPYRHREGNAAAHVKASLMGSSVTIPVRQGSMDLGTWQGIFFSEFDGPRTRRVIITGHGRD